MTCNYSINIYVCIYAYVYYILLNMCIYQNTYTLDIFVCAIIHVKDIIIIIIIIMVIFMCYFSGELIALT